MQMNQPEVALSGVPRAIDTAPSTCFRPVTVVRSRAIGGKPALALLSATPAYHFDLHRLRLVVHLTVRWNVPPS